MMGIQLTLTSHLFSDQPEQEVIVRDHLTVERLIQEICKEYDLSPVNHILRDQDTSKVLNPHMTLEQEGIQAGKVLIFEPGSAGSQSAVKAAKDQRAVLRSHTGKDYPIVHQPALIGRPNVKKNLTGAMLDVDLTDLDPRKTSSRPHGEIVRNDGEYYLSSSNINNLAYVNSHAVRFGTKTKLQHGDKLRFGSVTLEFLLVDRE